MNVDFLIVVYVAAGLQSVIAGSVFLLTKQENAPLHPRILSTLFFIVAIILLDMAIERSMFYLEHPQLGNIGKMLAATLPGLAYLYTRMACVEHSRFHWYDSLHALPFAIKAGVALFSYHLQPIESKVEYWQTGWQSHPINWPEISTVVLLMFAIQIIMLVRIIMRHRKAVLQVRSNTFDQSYLLIKWFGIAYIIQLTLNSVRAYLVHIEAYAQMHIITFVMGLWLYLMITALILGLIIRPERRIALSNEEVCISGFDNTNPGCDNKITENHHNEKLNSELTHFMEKHKPFLDPNLTLIQLSRKIGVPGRELFGYINQQIGCNFSDYIADWRVKEFKSRVKSAHYHGSITEVMFSVGFNSKSTFNTHFKKRTGYTPSEWKRIQPLRAEAHRLIQSD